MSGTLLIVFLVALVLIVFWRATLVIALALLLALLVMGVGSLSGAVAGADRPSVVAPGEPTGPGAPDDPGTRAQPGAPPR